MCCGVACGIYGGAFDADPRMEIATVAVLQKFPRGV